MKTISSLRPSLMQSQLLLKTAPFEPLWLGSCRIQLSKWGPLYAKLEAIATRVSVLESLLESENLPLEANLYLSVTWRGAVRDCAADGSTAWLCGLSWCSRRVLCTADAGRSISATERAAPPCSARGNGYGMARPLLASLGYTGRSALKQSSQAHIPPGAMSQPASRQQAVSVMLPALFRSACMPIAWSAGPSSWRVGLQARQTWSWIGRFPNPCLVHAVL